MDTEDYLYTITTAAGTFTIAIVVLWFMYTEYGLTTTALLIFSSVEFAIIVITAIIFTFVVCKDIYIVGFKSRKYDKVEVDYKMFIYDWYTSPEAHDPKRDGRIGEYIAKDYDGKGEKLYKIERIRCRRADHRITGRIPLYDAVVYARRILDAKDWKLYKENCKCYHCDGRGGVYDNDTIGGPKQHCLRWGRGCTLSTVLRETRLRMMKEDEKKLN